MSGKGGTVKFGRHDQARQSLASFEIFAPIIPPPTSFDSIINIPQSRACWIRFKHSVSGGAQVIAILLPGATPADEPTLNHRTLSRHTLRCRIPRPNDWRLKVFYAPEDELHMNAISTIARVLFMRQTYHSHRTLVVGTPIAKISHHFGEGTLLGEIHTICYASQRFCSDPKIVSGIFNPTHAN